MKSLIIGADGTIGRALAAALVERRDFVWTTTRRAASANPSTVHLDLASSDVYAMDLPKADVAFFCAAITGFAACRENGALARQVNVTAPAILAGRLVAVGTKVVLLSTSAVFDWRAPHVPAGNPPCPITVYGKLKADAEKAFSEFGPAASIVRLTKVLTSDDTLFKGWIDALNRKQLVTAFSDHHMAPITLRDAVATLLAISGGSESGLFQISADSDISYYNAALHLASRLGADPNLVIGTRASVTGLLPEEIIHHSSLDTSRIGALTGWTPPEPCAVIDEVFHASIEAARAGRSHVASEP